MNKFVKVIGSSILFAGFVIGSASAGGYADSSDGDSYAAADAVNASPAEVSTDVTAEVAPVTEYASYGYYIGVSSLEANVESASLDIEDSSPAITVGYKYAPGETLQFSVEATYMKVYDESETTGSSTIESESDAFAISFLLAASGVSNVKPYVRAGVIYGEIENNLYGTVTEEDDTTAILGVGLDFDLAALGLGFDTRGSFVRVDYSEAEFEDTDTYDAELISVGLFYPF